MRRMDSPTPVPRRLSSPLHLSTPPPATWKASVFPAQLAPLNVSRSNPDPNIDFSQFEPISAIPGYKPTNTIPYTESYMLSLQRQIGTNTLLSVSYVGNQAHHLLVLEAANPGNPALCLSLSQPSEVAPGSATCGPFGESSRIHQRFRASDQRNARTSGLRFRQRQLPDHHRQFQLQRPRSQPAPHQRPRCNCFVSYTYSKSIDQASNLGDQVDPFDPNLSRGLSSFDMRQNFVASYTYKLPFEHLFRADNRWTEGWSISGITRLQHRPPGDVLQLRGHFLAGNAGKRHQQSGRR